MTLAEQFSALHEAQTGQTGCLYHSAAVITGDLSLRAHVADTSAARFSVRLAERGLLVFTLFCAEPPEPHTSQGFWEQLRERFTRDNVLGARHAPLLVNIAGVTPGWTHQVALALPVSSDEDTVHLSDSNFPKPLALSWTQFLLSQYACAHRVELIGPLDLAAYPEALEVSP